MLISGGRLQVCKYIDIPLQHISNLTLLSMNRPPQDHTVKLLTKLRDRIPGLVLRTTFIAGFPGQLGWTVLASCLLPRMCLWCWAHFLAAPSLGKHYGLPLMEQY